MKLKLASAVLGCALLAGACVYVYQHNTKAVDFQGSSLPFSWQNANLYFVITDRFKNGDPSNDNSYGRP